MTLYTADQIFDLLGAVSCERDLIEIEHYVLTNHVAYAPYDVGLFLAAIDVFHTVIKPSK